MDRKMKYFLAGAVLSGTLVIILGYNDSLPLLMNILKAVYLFFAIGFTLCLCRELTQPASTVQTEGSE